MERKNFNVVCNWFAPRDDIRGTILKTQFAKDTIAKQLPNHLQK